MSTNREQSINARLARAIASVEAAPKDGSNPMFKSKYMTLDGVLSVVKPALKAESLALTQTTTFVPDKNVTEVKTQVVALETGEMLNCGTCSIPMVKLDAQAMGSATTYGRRYALTALFSLEAEDDDGNAASQTRIGRAEPIKGAKSAHDEEDPFMKGTYEEHRDAPANGIQALPPRKYSVQQPKPKFVPATEDMDSVPF